MITKFTKSEMEIMQQWKQLEVIFDKFVTKGCHPDVAAGLATQITSAQYFYEPKDNELNLPTGTTIQEPQEVK
jgi:hypothetical protein